MIHGGVPMDTLSLQIRKRFQCDVLVVGGGCAGLSAAVCSARNGADTILVDANGFLGGTATAGLVGPFMTSFDPEGKTQLIRGFFDEFVTEMERRGGAVHPIRATVGTGYSSYRTAGHNNCTAFHDECFKRTAEDICLASGVKLMYHMLLIHAKVTDGNVQAAYFATKDGIYQINAKVFVDCTGDGDLANLSGVPMVKGTETQATTLFFSIRGVDRSALDARMAKVPETRERFYMDQIEHERAMGNYPSYRSKLQIFEGIGGNWLVNMTQMDDVDGTDPLAVTAAEIEGRYQVETVIALLRKYVAGCANVELVKTAPSLGVRETRQIDAEYNMTVEDASNSVRFDDAVFCCSNHMDLHKKGYVDYVVRKSNTPYYFPYRGLQAKNVGNLLAAGRCAGAQREVMGAIRVMPPCFAMGQAAGTAAAMAVISGVSPKELDPGKLQQKLISDGVYIA